MLPTSSAQFDVSWRLDTGQKQPGSSRLFAATPQRQKAPYRQCPDSYVRFIDAES